MKGKLIVLEGGDGSGKATQLALLKKYLEEKNVSVKSIEFPRYEASFYGKLAKRLLGGEFGDISSVNPYLISTVIALDRADAKKEMDQWLSEGNIVLADRYATSNIGHQTGRLSEDKKEIFIQWNNDFEYTLNEIPREDLVIFLHMPFEISQKLLTDRGEKDILEKDSEYLKNAETTYLQFAKRFPHWVTIECVKSDGVLKSKEEIHQEVKNILFQKNILK